MAASWAIIALLFFLLFSVSPTAGERPEWYGIITYILEEVAFVGAALLCFRNWRSSAIVSGRSVWLAIGLGLLSYFIGNLFLAYWEVGLGKSPEVSPGDFFFILTYLFLGWGMLQAVISKQLNLTKIQWAILAAIAILGVAIALFFAPSAEEIADEPTPPSDRANGSRIPCFSSSYNPCLACHLTYYYSRTHRSGDRRGTRLGTGIRRKPNPISRHCELALYLG